CKLGGRKSASSFILNNWRLRNKLVTIARTSAILFFRTSIKIKPKMPIRIRFLEKMKYLTGPNVRPIVNRKLAIRVRKKPIPMTTFHFREPANKNHRPRKPRARIYVRLFISLNNIIYDYVFKLNNEIRN